MATNSAKIRPAKKLRIRLISGHHLPKTSRKLKGNVIEPYVQIKIHGHSIDQNEITSTVVPKVSRTQDLILQILNFHKTFALRMRFLI